jgi:hypothetical protein
MKQPPTVVAPHSPRTGKTIRGLSVVIIKPKAMSMGRLDSRHRAGRARP